jgi:hypothetical protein
MDRERRKGLIYAASNSQEVSSFEFEGAYAEYRFPTAFHSPHRPESRGPQTTRAVFP